MGADPSRACEREVPEESYLPHIALNTLSSTEERERVGGGAVERDIAEHPIVAHPHWSPRAGLADCWPT